MRWLVGRFGEERLLGEKVILPNEEFFPEPYDESGVAARVLLKPVCCHMEIDPARVDLHFFHEQHEVTLTTHIVRPDGGVVGLYSEQEGQIAVWLTAIS